VIADATQSHALLSTRVDQEVAAISQLALETSVDVKQISESSYLVSQLSEKLKLMVGQFKF